MSNNNSMAKLFDKVKFLDKVKILPNKNVTPPSPTYSLSRSAASVDEGSSITFTLTTTGVANGTSVPYSISGISAGDLSSGSLTGNFVINNGSAEVTVTLASDALTDGSETISITAAGQSSSATVNDTSLAAMIWTQLGQDIDGEAANDLSGRSISMNSTGDRVAIGALNNDGNGNNSGHVRVYSYNGSSWVKLGQDIDGEAANDASGFSVSMNGTGDRVAIGANHNDGNGSSSGHVRVYSYNGTSWVKLGQDINGEAAGDESGYSVSMNSAGDRVAIGANFNDGNGSSSGHVRVYSYNGSSWVKIGQDIDGEAAGDESGFSVSMNSAGDRVAIGAYGNDGNGNNSGHVRVYSYNESSWVKIGQDIDGEAANDWAGHSVSMNSAGDRVAVGAIYNDGNGSDSGRVRVYSYNGSSWVKIGQDIDGEAADDQFGFSVSMNSTGDRVAVGALFNDGNGSNSGHVRVYSYNGSSWIKLGQDIDGEAASDWTGYRVSFNSAGDRVAIGAIFNDGNGSDSGHVRVYTI